MNIVMIYDQIQAGAGTKDDTLVPIQGKRAALGPAVMMEPLLKKVDGHITACLFCGTETFETDPEVISRKFCAMVAKMNADVVICGPCFNYKAYAPMAAAIAKAINEKTDTPAICAMSEEMEDVIAHYQNQLHIVKMPKKGGTGLNDALYHILLMAKAVSEKKDIETVHKQYCYL